MTRIRRLVLLGLVVAGLWAAFVAWSVLDAHREIEAGRNSIRGVQTLPLDQLLDGSAEQGLATAHGQFTAATQRLEHPLVAPIRLLPWAGRQLSSVTALGRSARDASASVENAVATIRRAAGDGVPAGPERPATLRTIAGAAADLRADLADLDLGPENALIGRLFDARAEFERERSELDERLGRIETVTTGLADLLEGPHRYLVLAANNAQMQNGHGMFLDYAVLETAAGGFTLSDFQTLPNLPHPATPVALEPDIAAAWPWMDPNRDWRHLGMTARFPVTAETAQEMWAAIGQPPVDGVLAVDVVALSVMLELTGPVTVDGTVLDAGSAPEYLLHGQYGEFLGGGANDANRAAREDRLRDVAAATIASLQSADGLELGSLMALGDAAGGRHLLMWSSVPSHQAAFVAASIDGSLPADGLMVSVVNRGGNKLDWFVDVAASLDVQPSATVDRVTVTVDLHNSVDPTVEPRYVAGPYPGSGLQPGQYLGVVALTLPANASGITVDGGEVVVAGRDGQSELIGASTLINAGGDATVVVTFDLPATADSIHLQPSGRAHAIDWRVGASMVLDPDGSTLSW